MKYQDLKHFQKALSEIFKIKLIGMKYISIYQTLSENFIRDFQDKVNWEWISSQQKLSENFIR